MFRAHTTYVPHTTGNYAENATSDTKADPLWLDQFLLSYKVIDVTKHLIIVM